MITPRKSFDQGILRRSFKVGGKVMIRTTSIFQKTPMLRTIIILIALSMATYAQTHTILYSFTGGTDGWVPSSSLIRDGNGNLYGVTSRGGAYSFGTIFKLGANGNETVLHSFRGSQGGTNPNSLIGDGKGNFYGTTDDYMSYGAGTVFTFNPGKNHFRVLHSFVDATEGRYPGGLVRDANGYLYGTTGAGGAYDSGTVFRLDATGNITILYAFTGGADGGHPNGGLTLDAVGNLYGTTSSGGDPGCNFGFGCGTVFKLDAIGTETVLFSFSDKLDGLYPVGVPLLDRLGNLYGAARAGVQNRGIVFQLDTSGTETVLYAFTQKEGGMPGGLIWGEGSNLYGTTAGGTHRQGTIFKLNVKMGWYKVLYNFPGGVDGSYPGGLIRDSAGNLYGTTNGGGTYNQGTIFMVTP